MLTAGPYLNDLKAAQRGLDELRPLLLQGEPGYEAARFTLRKPPINTIRKSASKTILLLKEGSDVRKTKEASYEAIKGGLASIDAGCRPGLTERPDVAQLISQLQKEIDTFNLGLGVGVAAD